MRSLQKPRKITIKGSDGQNYMFLGKPKDDLRKDARMMDLNSIINKLLTKNSESRKRRLREYRSTANLMSYHITTGIRTYGVVTLNEECGFIQWVPNTVPMKPVLTKCYNQRQLRSYVGDLQPW
jgi:serine/threonine-protein kinase ATR